MWDKFGEMGSSEEINELAENLFNEGDTDSIRILAKENGIPEEYADLYISGELPYLCDAQTAAMGKLDIESEQLKLKGLMLDWVEYIRGLCLEDDRIAYQVRLKEKHLKDCMAGLLKYSFQNRISVDKKIVKAAGISASRVDFGIPGMGEAKKMIKEYYLGGTK